MHQQSDISESLEEYGFTLINDFRDTSLIDDICDMHDLEICEIVRVITSTIPQVHFRQTPQKPMVMFQDCTLIYKEFRLFSEVRESKIILQYHHILADKLTLGSTGSTMPFQELWVLLNQRDFMSIYGALHILLVSSVQKMS